MAMSRFLQTHNEKFIRLGGVLMLTAPVVNIVFSIATSHFPDPWSKPALVVFFRSVSIVDWMLSVSSLVVGGLMLKGRRSSWLMVLLILAVHTAVGAIFFARDYKASPLQAVLSLVTNIGIFSLVYWQEFRQTVARPLSGAASTLVEASRATLSSAQWSHGAGQVVGQNTGHNTGHNIGQIVIAGDIAKNLPLGSPAVQSKKRLRVEATDSGAWAEVVGYDKGTVRLRRTGAQLPRGLEKAIIEFSLPDGKSFRAKLSSVVGDEYVFSSLDLSASSGRSVAVGGATVAGFGVQANSDGVAAHSANSDFLENWSRKTG
jgi:hypothetical protein